MIKIGLLLAGYKAWLTLERIKAFANIKIEFISSYDDPNTLDDSYIKIQEFCTENKIKFVKRSALQTQLYQNVEKIFVIGWQYMLKDCMDKFIVLHDSYLPELKGWGPTVTSLIRGKEKLGATAFQPTSEIDSGPVYVQHQFEIKYPMKLREAFYLLAQLYANMIYEITDKNLPPKNLSCLTQARESYSIWRDRWDMYIDWRLPASNIKRFVDALGFPYSGAKTTLYDSDEIQSELIISDVEIVESRPFVIPQPGKIWGLENGSPLVICGPYANDNMIKIILATNIDGSPAEFKKLKQRFYDPRK